MINEVRVFDGEGNLKATVIPELVFDNMKKFQSHSCRNSSCKNMTTNRHYCTQACRFEVQKRQAEEKRIARKKMEELKPKRPCTNEGCEKKLEQRQSKFCSRKCAGDAGRDARHKKAEESKKHLKKLRETGNYFKGTANEIFR